MTSQELDAKIADAMAALRADNVVVAIKKAWKDYSDNLKDEARKDKKKGETLARAIDRLSDMCPCETYCYIMFDDEGDPRGWTIENRSYWQGNSGPSSAISIHSSTTYEKIEREIANDLYEALQPED